MRTRFLARAGIGLAAAIFAITALAPMASAQTDIRGRWNGFAETQLPAVQMGDSFFDVFTQARGRITGALEIHRISDPIPHLFPVAGFVRPNGVIFGSGREPDGGTVVFTGRARIIDPNLIIDPTSAPVQAMSLLYVVRDRLGNLMEAGVTVHIQMQGGLNRENPGPPQVPDLSGPWEGVYLPRLGEEDNGSTLVMVQSAEGSPKVPGKLDGTMLMLNVFVPAVQSFFDITYDLQGTVGVPAVQRDGSIAAPFGLIGVCPSDPSRPTIIAILIGLHHPPSPSRALPAIQGEYRLYDSFFDVFTEIALGGSTAFDQGSFLFQPVRPQDPPE